MRLLRNAAREQHGPTNRLMTPHEEKKKGAWDLQREVERMAVRLQKLGVGTQTAEMAQQLDTVEAELARGGPDSRLEGEIASVRVKLCTERGFDTEEVEKCERFMRQACGMDIPQDASGLGHKGARAATDVLVPRPECGHFFMAEKHSGSAGQAPAAAAAPAGVGAPAAPYDGPPILGGKAKRPLPSQGVVGPLVDHNDKQTSVDDWQKEFGPRSGHRSFQEICMEHPGNHWCRLHGYDQHGTPKSQAAGSKTLAALLAVVVCALRALV